MQGSPQCVKQVPHHSSRDLLICSGACKALPEVSESQDIGAILGASGDSLTIGLGSCAYVQAMDVVHALDQEGTNVAGTTGIAGEL